MKWVLRCLLILSLLSPAAAPAGVFDLEETRVTPSPAEAKYLDIDQANKVLDFDVARDGPVAAVLVRNEAGAFRVLFWDLDAQGADFAWDVPKGFAPSALAWHPAARTIFLAGKQDGSYAIMRAQSNAGTWTAEIIYKTSREIRRLVPAPRPYCIEIDYSSEDQPVITKAYRIFFGLKNQDGTYAIQSVTEDGKREYQAVGPARSFTVFPDQDPDAQPSRIKAISALPLAFHPAGHVMLWENEKKEFQYSVYERDSWGTTAKLPYRGLSGGTLTPTPNGIGLFHWKPNTPGITFISRYGKKSELLAADRTFLSTPSSVPDGRGIVGLVRKDKGTALAYVPVRIPLADVANAWMFVEGEPRDEELLVKNGGLLRDLEYDQLYPLYEFEGYMCGRFDQSSPTRPFLVTTDVFWELVAAAYEGLFIVKEKQQAIPAFWEFTGNTERFFRESAQDSPWLHVFAALNALRKGSDPDGKINAEVSRIMGAAGKETSPLLGADVDYSELKPRGHYTSSPAMSTYFRAFKYLTLLAPEALGTNGLETMPAEAREKALAWIGAYEFFISPGRAPLVWGGEKPLPPYARHPAAEQALFPLSWGIDNEVLLSTVYHEGWPEAEQVKGPSGPRLIPSALDVAAALGNRFAAGLLAPECEKYPPLRKTLEELRARFDQTRERIRNGNNLYDRWISALALQWADGLAFPGMQGDTGLWSAKRLQTGLASWATLRHATVLVNERTAAECGEAAFEPILMTPPRGYVEPDPGTFEAIAALFEAMHREVRAWDFGKSATMDFGEDAEEPGEREAVREGILARLPGRRIKRGCSASQPRKKSGRKRCQTPSTRRSSTSAGWPNITFLSSKASPTRISPCPTPIRCPRLRTLPGAVPTQYPTSCPLWAGPWNGTRSLPISDAGKW